MKKTATEGAKIEIIASQYGFCRVLSSIAFETYKIRREGKQKNYFQTSQTFGNLEMDFGINLNKSF